MKILYADKGLLLCEKPAGMPSQPDPSGQPDLLSSLQQRYQNVGLVHRLDTPTGGVMLYSLNPVLTGKLSALVQDHEHFVKEYLAVIPKPIDPPSGEMTDFLYHDKRRNKSFVVDKKRGGSKEANLSYQTVAVSESGLALVKVRLYTGRTHQIRVQFAFRGYSLCGDGKYGSRIKCPYIALWSHHIAFSHPQSRKQIEGYSLPDGSVYPWSEFDLATLQKGEVE